MEMYRLLERVRRIAEVGDASELDRVGVEAALTAEREVRGWLDAANARLVSKLSSRASFPEAAIPEASRCSTRDAVRRNVPRRSNAPQCSLRHWATV